MLSNCKNCGPLSEIAITKEKIDAVFIHEIKCMRCKQSIKRNTREAALLAWDHEQGLLWTEADEENFNRIIVGCADA